MISDDFVERSSNLVIDQCHPCRVSSRLIHRYVVSIAYLNYHLHFTLCLCFDYDCHLDAAEYFFGLSMFVGLIFT